MHPVLVERSGTAFVLACMPLSFNDFEVLAESKQPFKGALSTLSHPQFRIDECV